jgi:hypothetical protein
MASLGSGLPSLGALPGINTPPSTSSTGTGTGSSSTSQQTGPPSGWSKLILGISLSQIVSIALGIGFILVGILSFKSTQEIVSTATKAVAA